MATIPSTTRTAAGAADLYGAAVRSLGARNAGLQGLDAQQLAGGGRKTQMTQAVNAQASALVRQTTNAGAIHCSA